MKEYYVYIMANKSNSTIYIGVTNDLERRVYEHKNKILKGFTQRYNLQKLIYYENTGDIDAALQREKQLKGWVREKKNLLIEQFNPNWQDLSENFK